MLVSNEAADYVHMDRFFCKRRDEICADYNGYITFNNNVDYLKRVVFKMSLV
jgi:hypothetical protein